MNVGFIGLGRMGTGMAENLLRAGHRVTVYNRSPEKARPLEERGARVASSVGEVIAHADALPERHHPNATGLGCALLLGDAGAPQHFFEADNLRIRGQRREH